MRKYPAFAWLFPALQSLIAKRKAGAAPIPIAGAAIGRGHRSENTSAWFRMTWFSHWRDQSSVDIGARCVELRAVLFRQERSKSAQKTHGKGREFEK
jgi:hypothetical protein